MNIIHKVKVTPEAVFDYEDNMQLGTLNKADIKHQVEDYIDIRVRAGKRVDSYFKLKYLSENSDTTLLLFIKGSQRIYNMQIWDVVGICDIQDYDEDFEYDGINKVWYNSKVDLLDVPYSDWVVDHMERQKENERIQAILAEDYSK